MLMSSPVFDFYEIFLFYSNVNISAGAVVTASIITLKGPLL